MLNQPRTTWIASLRLLSWVVFAVVLLAAADSVACPTCKDGLAGSDLASQAQARGFFYSILFMMAMPFLLLGTLGSAAYWSIRRAREQQQSGAALEIAQ